AGRGRREQRTAVAGEGAVAGVAERDRQPPALARVQHRIAIAAELLRRAGASAERRAQHVQRGAAAAVAAGGADADPHLGAGAAGIAERHRRLGTAAIHDAVVVQVPAVGVGAAAAGGGGGDGETVAGARRSGEGGRGQRQLAGRRAGAAGQGGG